MKNILLTGGSGYIGSHVAYYLSLNNYNPIIYDNLSTGFRKLSQNFTFEKGDIRDKKKLSEVIQKYKIKEVMHFAAFSIASESNKNPSKYYENNVCGTINLLNTLIESNVKHVIFSSTAAIFGNAAEIPIKESTIKNPINVYGNNYKTPDGTCIRDYLHVLDIADAHLKALEKQLKTNTSCKINLGTKKGVSVLEIIKCVEKITDKKVPFSIVEPRKGDPDILVCDNTLAHQYLNWSPKYNIEDQILHAYNWRKKIS